MLRCNDSIRLTALDRQLYARVEGTQLAASTTINDYNQRLELAGKMWCGGRSAGELLLARMALELMLDPLDPSDVLSERQLGSTLFS